MRKFNPNAANILFLLATVIGSFCTVIWFAIVRGQDFNWDQQNYHIAVPFLLLHGTFWDSIAPSGIQSFLNPTVLVVQYAAMRYLSPIGFAILLGIVQTIPFVVSGFICRSLSPSDSRPRALLLAFFGWLVCLISPIALSEAGTTFFDLVTAVPVMLGYALLIYRGQWLSLSWSGALAGALLGLAAASKLTNAVFVVGLVGFCVTGTEPFAARIRWIAIAGAVAMLCYSAAAGYWHLQLWGRFGNPFFPYFNNFFRSPDYPPVAFYDRRFLPQSVFDIWRYPVYWLSGGSPKPFIGSPSSEQPFNDARWVAVIFGGTAYLGALLLRPRFARRCLAQRGTGLFLAIALDYLVWLAMFGYHRYIIPLEILSGAIILFLVNQFRSFVFRLVMLMAICVTSWMIAVVPDWGHLPWGNYWEEAKPMTTSFEGPAIVFLTHRPSAFIVTYLPPETRYVEFGGDFDLSAENDTSFTRRLKREVADNRNRLKVATEGPLSPTLVGLFEGYGLMVTHQCQDLHVADKHRQYRVCDLRRR
jgi:hypothetical protein